MILRILSGLMCGLFVLSAALQFNDPDPTLWVILYGVAAVVSAMGAAGRFTGFSWVVALAFLAYALYLAPKTLEPWTIMTNNPDDYTPEAWAPAERAREAGGLMICVVWLAVLGLVWFRKQHEVAEPQAPKAQIAPEE